MTWSTPRTWVTGEVVTAAEMNSNIRDNLNVLYNSQVNTSPGTFTFSTTAQVGASFTLTPGKWSIFGRAHCNFSTASSRTYTIDLFNSTDAVQLDSTVFQGGTSAQSSQVVLANVTLAASKTIQLRGLTSAVDGTQFFEGGRLVAIPG